MGRSLNTRAAFKVTDSNDFEKTGEGGLSANGHRTSQLSDCFAGAGGVSTGLQFSCLFFNAYPSKHLLSLRRIGIILSDWKLQLSGKGFTSGGNSLESSEKLLGRPSISGSNVAVVNAVVGGTKLASEVVVVVVEVVRTLRLEEV